jgi:hypothetical protein
VLVEVEDRALVLGLKEAEPASGFLICLLDSA